MISNDCEEIVELLAYKLTYKLAIDLLNIEEPSIHILRIVSIRVNRVYHTK